jgi:hypothetical protein
MRSNVSVPPARRLGELRMHTLGCALTNSCLVSDMLAQEWERSGKGTKGLLRRPQNWCPFYVAWDPPKICALTLQRA